MARGFTQPEQASLLVPYAGRYLAELETIWATHDGHTRVRLGELLFPYPAASPELLARIDEFLTRPRDPGLVRVLTDHRDTVQRALRSRALPVSSLPPGPPRPAGRAPGGAGGLSSRGSLALGRSALASRRF